MKKILYILAMVAMLVGLSVPLATPVSAAVPPGYTLVDTVSVPAYNTSSDGPVVLSNITTVNGGQYKIEASGTVYAGGNSAQDIECDAEWSQDDSQTPSGTWTKTINNYLSYEPGLMDLTIDGNRDIDWGDFNSLHVYTLDYTGTGSKIAFKIYDIYAQNNSGSLTVKIYKFQPAYCGYNGLLPPYSAAKAYKIGSSIPLKWQYTDCTNVVDSANANPSISIVRVSADVSGTLVEPINDPGLSGMRYDSLTMTWQFNWQTTGLQPGTYNISITEGLTKQTIVPFLITLR